MPLDKEDYKFPDEAASPDGEQESPGFEIEVEDDTPPEDRNRTPMPKSLVEDLETDELDAYDSTVKEKLKQMRKVWHDERREKEAALREQNEAVSIAHRLIAENKRIRDILTTGEKEYVTTATVAANLELDKAKRDYKEAYDAGDTDKLIEAQQLMLAANMKASQIQNFRMPSLQEENYEVQMPQQVPQTVRVDSKAEAWQERNPWFGENKSMTAFALGLHDELKDNGVTVGSDEYYSALDKTMRKRFPDAIGDKEPAQREQGRRPPTVVAPSARSTAPQKVRLRQSQMNLIKKLGITPEQYVREFVKENRNG
jgi:hypothetical protein